LTAADNELNIWIRKYMIKVLQLPAGTNSKVTKSTGMPKKRWSVQEAEQEQATGQARLIVEDSII
jgi:hypothetical protein